MYQCSTHGWVSMYTACPQCQPHIVSTATTNTEPHTKHTTGEQQGKDASYRANFLWGFPEESIEALGYEFANGKTEEYLKECWAALIDKIKSTPLPSKGQEGEAERKAKELVGKFYSYADGFRGDGSGGWDSSDEITKRENAKQCALICVDEILNSYGDSKDWGEEYIANNMGEVLFWQQVRTIIVNL